MKDYPKMTVTQLIQELIKEVVYDAHSVWISYGRSGAREELLSRGNECFQELGAFIAADHQYIPTLKLFKDRNNETYALLVLLGELVATCKLKSPYEDVIYSEQEFFVWANFCRQHSLNPV